MLRGCLDVDALQLHVFHHSHHLQPGCRPGVRLGTRLRAERSHVRAYAEAETPHRRRAPASPGCAGRSGRLPAPLHQDLTRPGFGHRDLTKFAGLLRGHQLKRFQGCTTWGRIWSKSTNTCRGPRNTWLIRYGGGSSTSRGLSTRRRNASNAVLTSRRASGPPKQT